MAVSFVASASAANTNLTDVTSVTVSKPTGTADGDFMFAVASGYQSTSWTTPSGWAVWNAAVDSGTNLRVRTYYKIASSEPSSYNWTISGTGGSINVSITTLRGIEPSFNEFSWQIGDNTSTDPSSSYTLTAPATGGLAVTGLAWHATVAGGSPTVTCTASAGWTERVDVSRIDGSPSTHERGQCVYVANSTTSGGATSASNSINPTGSINNSVKWTLVMGGTTTASGTSTGGGVTSSGTGSVTSNPAGSGTSTLGGVTSSGTGQQYITGSGGSGGLHVTSDGVGAMQPKGSGTSTLGAGVSGAGVQSSGTAVVSGTKLEIKVDGVWTDITEYLRHAQGVQITRGRSGSAQAMSTTRCSFTLDNRDNIFSPFNPSRAFYGYLKRNTEVRLTKQESGVRFHGEMSSFTFGTDMSGNDLTVAIECAGLLRRLEQGETPTKSPIYREITTNTLDVPLHYWPCEDAEGSKTFYEAYGNARMRWTGGTPTLSTYDGYKCTEKIPDVNSTVWKADIVGGDIFNDGYNVSFLMSAPSGITNGAQIMSVLMNLSGSSDDYSSYEWSLEYDSTNTLLVRPPALTGGTSSTGSFTVAGELIHVQVLVKSHSGSLAGDASMSVYCQNITDASPTLVATATASNGPGGLKNPRVRINPDETMTDVYIGHVVVFAGDTVRTFNSLNAYLGEAAGTRFERLCGEEGITFEANGTMSDTESMGYQTSKNFTDLLRECEDTDLGVMYEIRDNLGLGYRTRKSLYNQTATATFDYTGGHLLEELKPIYDDKDVRNDVTVTRDGGSSSRYEVTTGSMSTSAVPNGIGRYDDSVTVSLESDDDTYSQAGWRAHLGTVDEVRVSSISSGLDIPEVDADSALQAEMLSLDVGDRVVITNTPDWLPLDGVDQHVVGYTERWDQFEHRFSYVTEPAAPYRIAVVAAAGTSSTQAKVGKDSGTTTLDSPIGTAATSLSVAVASGSLWTTSGVDFDIIVNGEQMTVTSVSGASSPQTFTVTRSINGVVKEHAAGSEVKLYKPAVIAL